jgi:hypothetical protein
MAHELHLNQHSLPIAVATDIDPRRVVQLAGTNIPLVIPIGTNNIFPFGVTAPATYVASSNALPSPGRDMAAVYFTQNCVKVKAFASVGAGADVMVATTSGAVGPNPITASAHWIVGQTMEDGLAGEIVTIFINPRKA